MNHPSSVTPPIERLHWPEADDDHIIADVLRLDLLHPVMSGNKSYKLEQHLSLARHGAPLITFGGAWSNHLVATAYAAQQAGRKAIGIIRGQRPLNLSATLQESLSYGMELKFISRLDYAAKTQPAFLQDLCQRYPGAYIIPEGGGGLPGVLGSEEILHRVEVAGYTHILCAVGTGTTWMGLVRAAAPDTTVLGIPVLKGIGVIDDIDREGFLSPTQRTRARLLPGWHLGGYARHPPALLEFMNNFYQGTGIPTDLVYTGKLFYALWHIRHFFPAHSRLLIIHSGGLQGNRSLPPGRLVF